MWRGRCLGSDLCDFATLHLRYAHKRRYTVRLRHYHHHYHYHPCTTAKSLYFHWWGLNKTGHLQYSLWSCWRCLSGHNGWMWGGGRGRLTSLLSSEYGHVEHVFLEPKKKKKKKEVSKVYHTKTVDESRTFLSLYYLPCFVPTLADISANSQRFCGSRSRWEVLSGWKRPSSRSVLEKGKVRTTDRLGKSGKCRWWR